MMMYSCNNDDYDDIPVLFTDENNLDLKRYENFNEYNSSFIPEKFSIEANSNREFNSLAFTTDGSQKCFIATISNNHTFFAFCDSLTGRNFCTWYSPDEIEDFITYEGYGVYRIDTLEKQNFYGGYKNYQESYLICLKQTYISLSNDQQTFGHLYNLTTKNILFFCNQNKVNKVVTIKNRAINYFNGYCSACIIDSFCYDILSGDSLYKCITFPPSNDFESKNSGLWLSNNEIIYIEGRNIYKRNLQFYGKDWIKSVPNLENEPINSKITYRLLLQTELHIKYIVKILRYDGSTSNFEFEICKETGEISIL